MEEITSQIVDCIPALRRYARGLAGNANVADDLVQDALERAWREIEVWQRRGELRAWLFSILHNRYIDALRSDRIRGHEPLTEESRIPPARATQTDLLEVRDLDQALGRLPREQREVLLLVAVEQLRYDEVARVLGIPPGTVMSRLARARERLRAILGDTGAPPRLRIVK